MCVNKKYSRTFSDVMNYYLKKKGATRIVAEATF